MFWPFTIRIIFSSDLKKFWPSASNFKSFFRSIKLFFLTEGKNKFENKTPFLRQIGENIITIWVLTFFQSFCLTFYCTSIGFVWVVILIVHNKSKFVQYYAKCCFLHLKLFLLRVGGTWDLLVSSPVPTTFYLYGHNLHYCLWVLQPKKVPCEYRTLAIVLPMFCNLSRSQYL